MSTILDIVVSKQQWQSACQIYHSFLLHYHINQHDSCVVDDIDLITFYCVEIDGKYQFGYEWHNQLLLNS